mmetsp:Transcript_122668/g.217255  ORF Transcript_122668/g.217255 Transcript_122668/m.217255 type:complete len:111 (-) Transcript_122668:267-599(-)
MRAADRPCPAAAPPADTGLGVAGGCGEKALVLGEGVQLQPTVVGVPDREALWSIFWLRLDHAFGDVLRSRALPLPPGIGGLGIEHARHALRVAEEPTPVARYHSSSSKRR